MGYMKHLNDVLRMERERTGNYGADIREEDDRPCPFCGRANYDYLIRGYDYDIVGCDECCVRVYRGEE